MVLVFSRKFLVREDACADIIDARNLGRPYLYLVSNNIPSGVASKTRHDLTEGIEHYAKNRQT